MSVGNPSLALFDLLQARVQRRNNAFRRRAPLLIGAALLVTVIVVTLAAPLITSYDPNEIDPLNPLAPPLTPGHILGTDNFGRDILSRILYGGRIDLLIAFGATSVTLVVGTAIGLFSGLRRRLGRLDDHADRRPLLRVPVLRARDRDRRDARPEHLEHVHRDLADELDHLRADHARAHARAPNSRSTCSQRRPSASGADA